MSAFFRDWTHLTPMIWAQACKNSYGLPRRLGGKESPATAGDAGLIPGSRRFYGGENATHSSILA